MADSDQRNEMGKNVLNYSKGKQVLCFQEVHGADAEIRMFFSALLPNWHISISATRTLDGSHHPDSGGVVIAICPHLRSSFEINTVELVSGRCVAGSILADDKSFTIVNIHNFGFTKKQVQLVGRCLASTASKVKEDPSRHFAVCIGDLNFAANFEKPFRVGENFASLSSALSPPPVLPHSAVHANQWKSFLDHWTEITQPFPTYFNNRGPSLRRIDRVWTPIPNHLIIKLHVHSEVVTSPESLFAQGLSDHGPLLVTFGKKQFCGNSAQPIPKFVCKHPSYATFFDCMRIC